MSGSSTYSGKVLEETTYTHDALNHLTNVAMPRSGYTQTLTFSYGVGGNNIGAYPPRR